MRLNEIDFIPNRIKQRKVRIRKAVSKSVAIIVLASISFAGRYYIQPVLKDNNRRLIDEQLDNEAITKITNETAVKIKAYNQKEKELKQYIELSDNLYNLGEFISEIVELSPEGVTVRGLHVKYVKNVGSSGSMQREEQIQVEEPMEDVVGDVGEVEVKKSKKKNVKKIYEKVPNVLVIDGEVTKSNIVGQYITKLTSWNERLSDIKLDSISKNDETGKFDFTISALIKGGN